MPNNTTPVVLIPPTLPEGWCFTTFQNFINYLYGNTQAYLSAQFNGIIISGDAPGVNFRDRAWLRLDNTNAPDKIYAFYNGVWVSKHSIPSGTRCIAPASVTSAAAAWAYDGGDGTDPATNPPTSLTGAMWEVDTTLQAHMPIGFGTLPSGTVLNVGTAAGEEKHVLTVAEMPAHNHTISAELYPALGSGTVDEKPQSAGPGTSGSTGGGQSHNNMPPYIVVPFLRRTARLFYTA